MGVPLAFCLGHPRARPPLHFPVRLPWCQPRGGVGGFPNIPQAPCPMLLQDFIPHPCGPQWKWPLDRDP